MEYKGFKVDDNKIDEYVEKLGCSIFEACDLILEESGKIDESEETKNAIKNAEKNAPRRYEKSGTRKKTVKERKVDEDKAEILALIQKAFDNHSDIEVTGQKTETELYIEYGDSKYTIKLTKHRPPKK